MTSISLPKAFYYVTQVNHSLQFPLTTHSAFCYTTLVNQSRILLLITPSTTLKFNYVPGDVCKGSIGSLAECVTSNLPKSLLLLLTSQSFSSISTHYSFCLLFQYTSTSNLVYYSLLLFLHQPNSIRHLAMYWKVQ